MLYTQTVDVQDQLKEGMWRLRPNIPLKSKEASSSSPFNHDHSCNMPMTNYLLPAHLHNSTRFLWDWNWHLSSLYDKVDRQLKNERYSLLINKVIKHFDPLLLHFYLYLKVDYLGSSFERCGLLHDALKAQIFLRENWKFRIPKSMIGKAFPNTWLYLSHWDGKPTSSEATPYSVNLAQPGGHNPPILLMAET